ncbi:MAG: hypothetical protein II054_04280 [Treponema sp.]|nr:hypothetical protein [Treponema sp.]
MKELTERQKEILDFIAQFTDDNAYAPTVREICDHFNISIRAVQDHGGSAEKGISFSYKAPLTFYEGS